MRRSKRDIRSMGRHEQGDRRSPEVDPELTSSGRAGEWVRERHQERTARRVGHPARFEMTVGAFLSRQRAGALHEGPRAELVAGRPVPVRSLDPPEAAALVTLAQAFRDSGLVDMGIEVLPWAPLRLGPVDLVRAAVALLPGPAFEKRRSDGESSPTWSKDTAAAPGIGGSHDPASALLVVETMTTASAQSQRLARYAAAGAREVWLLDVRRGWVESLRSPWRGEYRSRTLWYPGEVVPISALHTVSVEALVPP